MRAENASSAGSGARAVLADEHELEVAACDADLDVRGLELVVQLERRLGEASWSRRPRDDSIATERSSAARDVVSSPSAATRTRSSRSAWMRPSICMAAL